LSRNPKTFRRPAAKSAPEADVAVSCRVRLARNLAGHRFPDWAGDSEREKIRQRLEKAVMATPAFRKGVSMAVEQMDDLMLEELWERRLISRDLMDCGAGSGVAISRDATLSVMFNEEDHLRIQVLRPGMDVKRAWELADQVDTQIERNVRYAFDETLGYLTSCPSNLGTALRASVMLHLPGLHYEGDLQAVFRALDALRVEVRGMGGEGSESVGTLVQVSNQGTLGLDEPSVVSGLLRIVDETVRQERFARRRLLRDRPLVALDYVARSLAMLKNARIMGFEEAVSFLYALQLGLEWGMLDGIDRKTLDTLVEDMQLGFLRRSADGVVPDPFHFAAFRCVLLGEQLSNVELRS
jgi:protein arginine kinase